MKLQLQDGNSVDDTAVGIYDHLIRSLALLSLLDVNSLRWLQTAVAAELRQSQAPSDIVLVAFLEACEAEIALQEKDVDNAG